VLIVLVSGAAALFTIRRDPHRAKEQEELEQQQALPAAKLLKEQGDTRRKMNETVKEPQWETSTSVDEMSGKHQAFARSPIVSPTKPMGFPYSDVQAWLGVGCDGSNEWAYIGFTESPNLLNTETRDLESTEFWVT
jgi:arsenate reductase-like glutaredoxin family protein